MIGSAERLVRDGDIVVREQGALRRLTLNRPKALNALTLDMAATMLAQLRAWQDDAAVGAVLIDGAGERALCAGGDLRALYDAAKSGDDLPARFWSTEYRLDLLIARYRKPVIAIMDGMVMGGGVGISAHAAHRVVTERSTIAMPEVGIGYFPDVGASFLLARAPGRDRISSGADRRARRRGRRDLCRARRHSHPCRETCRASGGARGLPHRAGSADVSEPHLQSTRGGQAGRGAPVGRGLLWGGPSRGDFQSASGE